MDNKDIIILEENEANLFEGIMRDIENIAQLISFCCSDNNAFKEHLDNEKFQLLIELRKQKILEKDMLIKAFILKYNINNRQMYQINGDFKGIVFYDAKL